MDRLEKLLIEHCSPTLASLKVANLFTCLYTSDLELQYELERWNREMNPKGISLTVLRKKNNRALIYVYRSVFLNRILENRDIKRFLSQYGYPMQALSDVLDYLKERMEKHKDFPHEIGIFLGYPLVDVIGFIQNCGKNFLCSGLWKVYGNPEETQRTFQQYKKCTTIYLHLWKNGRSATQLTVAA